MLEMGLAPGQTEEPRPGGNWEVNPDVESLPPISTNDLIGHFIKLGMDIYPPIAIPMERTKLSVFGDEACSRWPSLFDKVEAGSTEFSMSKAFSAETDPRVTATVRTFALTDRGPVFIAPILLLPPGGQVGSEEEFMDRFPEVRSAFLRSVGGRDCLRIGLIRELVFTTGQTSCTDLLTSQTSFAEASLIGGKNLLLYRDDLCNVRITLEPVQLGATTRLAIGQEVREERGNGLKVQLDVNNHGLDGLRALEDADMQQVFDRATSLWPDELLEYINALRSSG